MLMWKTESWVGGQVRGGTWCGRRVRERGETRAEGGEARREREVAGLSARELHQHRHRQLRVFAARPVQSSHVHCPLNLPNIITVQYNNLKIKNMRSGKYEFVD